MSVRLASGTGGVDHIELLSVVGQPRTLRLLDGDRHPGTSCAPGRMFAFRSS